ncbi:transposase, Mutator family protein [Erwinia tracheiphila PSU-1]|nr:transposase, Mutator family protein [Erwinia tracheiphila PSU-1]
MEQVTGWQNRPLDAVCPIVYPDCIVLKVRQDSRVINKSVFLAPGLNIEGQKELPGMWLAENEGAKFWLHVLAELKNRGLNDILIACVDGLKGFPDAINAVYPQACVQLCVVHMVRNSLRFVSWEGYKAVTRDLKAICQATTEEAGAGSVRRRPGQPLPADKPELAGKPGQPVDVLRLPGRHPQDARHDQRHRVAEQRDPGCHQEAEGVPD